MGYQVGKLVAKNNYLINSIDSLKKINETSRQELYVSYHHSTNEIWFKMGRYVLARIDRSAVKQILRYREITHIEGGGIFVCPKTLKEMHDEVVYADDYLAGSEEFYFVSLVQYKFSLSPAIISRVPKSGSYVLIPRRSSVKKGRKPGYILEPEPITEPESETRNRIRYNKQVALKRGLYSIFEEAEKDRCRLDGVKFSKDLCVEKWNEFRRAE